MKILLAHNRYLQRGGEDMVFEDEAELLRAAGHEVQLYLRDNAELQACSRWQAARQSMWSDRTVAELDALFKEWKPDVLHVHNTFQVMSASVYRVAARHRVPVVQTLHNFRMMCLQGSFFRNGQFCEDCLGQSPWHGVHRRCYRGSASQSAVLAAGLVLHRGLGTYQQFIHRYIAVNEFSRMKFVQAGWPAERICVKPNFTPWPALIEKPEPLRRGGLFIGRLTPEKGADVLAAALARPALPEPFMVAGEGPSRPAFAGSRAQLLGWQSASDLHAVLARALYLVVPSLTYETGPRVVAEAFAMGVPVIASAFEPLLSTVQEGVTGLHFEAGNSAHLAEVMAWADANPEAMRKMGDRARRAYAEIYAPEPNLEKLMRIYSEAIECCVGSQA